MIILHPWVVGSGLVGRGVGCVALHGWDVLADLSLVLDVGVVRFVLVHVVVDNLGAAVGKKDLVLA
jgi:hypothetical protein